MKKRAALLSIIAAFCLVAGCYSEGTYEGDGVLVDKGLFAIYGRYDLRLGDVSLSESRDYIFRASKLPQERFAAGFNVQSLPNDEAYASVFVQLQILNEEQQIVVDEAGPLSEWVWGHAIGGSESFVYRRGKSRDVQTAEGTFKPIPVDVKADDGHGSYFKPRPKGRYEVRITIKAEGLRNSEKADVMFSGVGPN